MKKENLTAIEKDNQLLNLNLELPNHKQNIKSLSNILEYELKPKINQILNHNIISDDEYYNMVDEVLDVLYKIGNLSLVVFNIRDELEDKYSIAYRHSPFLAKKLWQKHYHELHKPYNIVKNNCFNYLDQLENHYIKINNHRPINKHKIIV